MPAQTRPTQSPTAPTTTDSAEVSSPPRDLTDGRGNQAQQDNVIAPAEDASLLAEEPQRLRERAGDVEEVTLSEGAEYVVTEEDMGQQDPWRFIARNNGMTPENLRAFNQHVQEVDLGQGKELQAQPLAPLAVGTVIYIPSAQELGFAECRKKAGSYEGAIELWGQMTRGPNTKMLDAARHRASGEIGESYGTKGVDGGRFYTANPGIAGASRKNSEVIDGQREYAVFWLADFWKCSVFMNDVVFQAGYEPALMANGHYATAGRAHEQPQYEQVTADDAMPGDCFQRFGGRGSDQSHNTVISTFVEEEPIDENKAIWRFSYIGAESERAAEAEKEFVVNPKTGEVVEGGYTGNILRFLRPVSAR